MINKPEITRRKLLGAAASVSVGGNLFVSSAEGAAGTSRIPGGRSIDHAGVVVRNLDEAVRFFVEVVGAELLFRSSAAAGLESKEEASLGTTVSVAFLRFGPNLNLELLQFTGPDNMKSPPRVSENGAVHIAIWVDDVTRAANDLRTQPGVEIVGEVGKPSTGADKGATWIYARTAFGVHLELVNRPAHLPYEQRTAARLYGPAKSWR